MKIEYKIIYRIGGDIPVNPAWVGEKIEDAVDKLQIELHEKNLQGTHTLEFCYPEGWKPQASSNKRPETNTIK